MRTEVNAKMITRGEDLALQWLSVSLYHLCNEISMIIRDWQERQEEKEVFFFFFLLQETSLRASG